MWEAHIIKKIKNKKIEILIKDIYLNTDGTIGAISDKNYSLTSKTIKELSEKIEFIQTLVFGREIVIMDSDKNKIYMET